MFTEFEPLVRSAHFLTIASNFWPRKIDEAAFPAQRVTYPIDSRNSVVAFEHQVAKPRGQVVLLHGLEGSANAGYFASFAQAALERGFSVHRLNMRSCGGTEECSETMYHSGLTGDPRIVLTRLHERGLHPVFLVGFSLGGNVALKLAGELGETNLLAGVCAVSTPIDLAACVRALDRPSNVIYARRFLSRLRERIRRKSMISPDVYDAAGLDDVRSIWEFDDRYTARLFGFGTAANYYETQSAARFLHLIRLPTLVITAEDDPIVPFEIYKHPAFKENPALSLLASRHGGHLGFIARQRPRFWLDSVCLDWFDSLLHVK